MSAATLRPPEAAGIGRGFAFAVVAHALLVVALSYSLNWHSTATPAFEAELWSAVPQVAAPREEAPPEPEPEAPKPDLKAQQQAAEDAAEQREAEIAIARARKLKEEKAREEAVRLEREKAAKDKAAKDKALKDEQDRKKDKAAKDAKEARDTKQAKDADARREAQRQENLRRIQGMAGATGSAGSTGTAARDAAPSAGYGGRIKARIRPMIIYSAEGPANPEMEVRITLAPDGRILSVRVLKASPEPDWDRAVLRGIEKADSVPRDIDGRVPGYIDLVMRPRE
jgi:colicin import membrane protein